MTPTLSKADWRTEIVDDVTRREFVIGGVLADLVAAACGRDDQEADEGTAGLDPTATPAFTDATGAADQIARVATRIVSIDDLLATRMHVAVATVHDLVGHAHLMPIGAACRRART